MRIRILVFYIIYDDAKRVIFADIKIYTFSVALKKSIMMLHWILQFRKSSGTWTLELQIL